LLLPYATLFRSPRSRCPCRRVPVPTTPSCGTRRGSTRRRTARPRRPSRRAGRRRWGRCRCARTSPTAEPRRPARPCRAWHDGGMERLEGEARDRVRAASQAGAAEGPTVPGEVVAGSADGRVVTVGLVHGACQDPLGLAVDEGRGAVVLTARVVERTPPSGSACPSRLVVSRVSVVLDE